MRLLTFFFASIFFFSCNQKQFNSKEELLKYLQNEENGYVQKKRVNGVDYSLMYRPTDLVISQVLKSKNFNDIDSLRKKYNKYLYFNLSISQNRQEILNVIPKDKKEYIEILHQLTFGLQEKIHLYTDHYDTIGLVDYIYPRTYGIGNKTSIMFVFPKDRVIMEADCLNITIEEFGIQTGEIKFKFLNRFILDEPTISFN